MAYGVVIIEFSGCFYNKEQIGVEKWTEEDLRFLSHSLTEDKDNTTQQARATQNLINID